MRFEWDPAKNLGNQTKHGLSFEAAIDVFADAGRALELFDELHSDDEERFITIGPIRGGLVLVVWTEVADDITRVISARRATPRERSLYLRHMKDLR